LVSERCCEPRSMSSAEEWNDFTCFASLSSDLLRIVYSVNNQLADVRDRYSSRAALGSRALPLGHSFLAGLMLLVPCPGHAAGWQGRWCAGRGAPPSTTSLSSTSAWGRLLLSMHGLQRGSRLCDPWMPAALTRRWPTVSGTSGCSRVGSGSCMGRLPTRSSTFEAR
jgi:hypothetical protein